MSNFGNILDGLYSGSSGTSGGGNFSTISTTSPITADGSAGGSLTTAGSLGILPSSDSQNGYVSSSQYARFSYNEFFFNYIQLGGVFKSQLLSSFSTLIANTEVSQLANNLRLCAVNLPSQSTINSIGFYITFGQSGSSTPNGFNGFAIYSLSGTTLNRIAQTPDDINNWVGKTAESWYQVNLDSPIVLPQGIYWIASLYNVSGVTSPPRILGLPNTFPSGTANQNLVFPSNVNKLSILATGITSMPSTIDMTTSVVSNTNQCVFLI
jgi:hypothetical protein